MILCTGVAIELPTVDGGSTDACDLCLRINNQAAPDGPADIGVDRRRKRLLIPLFNANELVIVQLEQ
jgi:hypothetical protein